MHPIHRWLPVVLTLVLGASFGLLLARDNTPIATFDAVAEVTGPQGTRTLPVSIAITNPINEEQARQYRELLRTGGQNALVNAIRYNANGQLLLGAQAYQLNLVLAERMDDRWKYTIVTARNARLEEETLTPGTSVDYPFTLAQFEVEDGRRGEGTIVPRAALSISEDGRVAVQKYEGMNGRLKDVKRR